MPLLDLRQACAAMLGLLLLVSHEARGAEFVLMNKTVSYSANDNAFRGTVHADQTMPADWSSPDDFYHGTVYASYEAISVPSSVKFGMQVCFFQYYPTRATWDGTNYNENCSTVTWLTGTGSTATFSGVPSLWWKMGGRDVDFSRVGDFESFGAVIWGSNPDAPLSPTNGGGNDATYAQRANWFPSTVRVVMVAVSAGSTFSGWASYLGGADGGATGTDAGSADAGSASDAGLADAGSLNDAGSSSDAGGTTLEDAGTVEPGTPAAPGSATGGCGCQASDSGAAWMAGLLLACATRRSRPGAR